jgi:hypothetical protein
MLTKYFKLFLRLSGHGYFCWAPCCELGVFSSVLVYFFCAGCSCSGCFVV